MTLRQVIHWFFNREPGKQDPNAEEYYAALKDVRMKLDDLETSKKLTEVKVNGVLKDIRGDE